LRNGIPKGLSWTFLARDWQPFLGCHIPPLSGLDQDQVAHVQPPSPAKLQQLFRVIFPEGLTNGDALVDAAKKGNRWWCLTEQAMRLVHTKAREGSKAEQLDVVYRAIYAIIFSRRAMSTVITTPDGIRRSPMDGMPPFNIATAMLKYGKGGNLGLVGNQATDDLVEEVTSLMVKSMKILSHVGDGDSGNHPPARSMRMVIHRQLKLLAVDYKLFVASFGDDIKTRHQDAGLIDRDICRVKGELEKMVVAVWEKREIARYKGIESPPPALGVQHTQQLVKHDLDGGLCYLYELTAGNPLVLAPTADRFAMANFAMTDAPVIWSVVDHIFRNKTKRQERTLVFCESAIVQQ